MVVDSLLLKLNALGNTAQAYADDMAIVMQGKYLNSIADLMRGSLRVVDTWCKTKGLCKSRENRSFGPVSHYSYK